VATGVPPGLKVVADDDGVEADFLGNDGELQQLARPKLLSGSLVAEGKQPNPLSHTCPKRSTDAVSSVVSMTSQLARLIRKRSDFITRTA
jgi:hypothetical protein